MPQDQRRRSCDEYDVISADFPPPSLKPTNSPDQDKRKKKKWSLGGLFRRKKKESDTDSSSPLEEEEKRGFLEKRRARKRRNRGSKDVTGSFEHVIINHRQSQVLDSNTESKDVSAGRIARSHETLVKREPNHIRGSSVSLEGVGRKGGRLQVKARVEESRERLRGESSSDEGGGSSKHSSSSYQRSKAEDNVSKDGSLSRRSRAARTERYKKRLSKDDESLRDFHVPSRISRSDERLSNKKAERPVSSNRWTAKVVYYESSDYDTKYTAITKSATPSPIQSPKARPKNALHYTASAPAASNYVTYPPSHAREGVVGSYQELRNQRSVDRVPLNHKYPDVTPLRLPKSNSEMITKNAQLPSSIQRHYPSWGQDALNRKSASYDCNVNNIHYVNSQISQPHPTEENVLVVQFPLSRPVHKAENKVKMGLHSLQSGGKQQNPPPPPPRDPHRKLVPGNGLNHESSPRPMSYAFEDRGPMQSKYTGYHEFGSTSSAFQRVPQTQSGPIDFDPVKSMNKHQRSSSDNHIPRMGVKQSPPMTRKMPENDQKCYQGSHNSYASSPPSDNLQSAVPCHYQYYTDLQPRSRKPIHIAYQNQKPHNDSYLSDSQVVVKPPVQQTPRARPPGVQNAADFWKQKDQESAKKVHLSEGSPKLIQRHLLNLPAGNERSRSNSPLKDSNVSLVKSRVKLPPLIIPVKGIDVSSSLNNANHRESLSPRTPNSKKPAHNEIGIPVFEGIESNNSTKRPLSMLEEKQETSEKEVSPARDKLNNPPIPPQRRDSKVNAVTNFEHFDIFSDNENKDGRRKSSNLEEALNELEAIYKSLRLGEENYLEKVAKEQSVYENNRLDPSNWNAWVQSRGFESDSSFNYSRSSLESVDSVDSPLRSSNSRRSGVPDRVTDDMAYRRLNKKDRPSPQEQEVLSQAGSFLLVSPTLSPPPLIDPPPVTNITKEPDVEKDDVVYRTIKHVNNSLKCLDPQPPFGIPLGPITPAPNSDYLHVSHKESFRPSFKPRKIPDVVTDDLAFRNLRKDNNKEPLFTAEDSTFLDSPTMKKKKAVRSLSANLLGIIQRESAMKNNNNKLIYNNNTVQGELEKSHSFTDVHGALIVNTRTTNGYGEQYQKFRDTTLKKNLSGEDSDVTPRVSRLFSTGTSSPLTATSTETLTGSKNSLWTPESKTGNPKLSKSPSPKLSLTPERRHTTDNVYFHPHKPTSPSKYIPGKGELSKHSFSASYPKSNFLSSTHDSHTHSHESNKTRETSPPVYDQKESDLLAILAREAKEASEQLSKELNELNIENSLQPKPNYTSTALEINKDQIEKKVSTSILDSNAKQPTTKLLTIGKVIPHKPVKLNTYIITEDDKLESKQTVITNNSPIDIEGSKSMTDLLKELTRSLDVDFGSYTKETLNQVPVAINEGISNEKEESRQNAIETNYDGTSIDEELTNFKECEEKYFSSQEDVSDERFSSPEKFLQSFIAEAIEKQKEQTDQNNKKSSTSSEIDIHEEPEENQKLLIVEDIQTPSHVDTVPNDANENSISNGSLEECEKHNEDESVLPITISPEKEIEKINETYSLITEQDSTEVDDVLNTLKEEHSEQIPPTSSPLPNRFPLVLPQDELIESKSSEVTSHSSNDADTIDVLGIASVSLESSPPGPSGESKLVPARPRDCIDCPKMTDEGTKTMADPGTLLLVCMACANLLAGLELDFLTVLGIVLAIACLFLFLIV